MFPSTSSILNRSRIRQIFLFLIIHCLHMKLVSCLVLIMLLFSDECFMISLLQDGRCQWMALTLQLGKRQGWPLAARNCPWSIWWEPIWATARRPQQQEIVLNALSVAQPKEGLAVQNYQITIGRVQITNASALSNRH